MPAPKVEVPVIDKKDLKIIDYSRMSVRVYDPKDKSDNPAFTYKMKDVTPSQPPWTTWCGILEARRDSPVGKRILATDPDAIDGATASPDKLEKMHERPPAEKKEWVRGLWIAPENWKDFPEF